MPTLAISELVEEAEARQGTNGLFCTRAFLVDGLTSTTGPMLEALTATGLPVYGEPHPDGSTIQVIDIQVKPFLRSSRTKARVVVTYGPPQGDNTTSIFNRYSAISQEVRTNFEQNGDTIQVGYVNSATDTGTQQMGVVTGRKSIEIKTWDLLLNADPTAYTYYINGVNQSDWLDKPKYTWRIDRVEVEKAKYLAGWHLLVVAVYDPETHLKTAFWRDIHGNIPSDIDLPVVMEPDAEGNGWKTILPRGLFLANLNAMNLPAAF